MVDKLYVQELFYNDFFESLSMMRGDTMNSYQSIGMYLYHTCCRSTRIFGQGILLYRSYWSKKHSIHKVTFFLYLTNFS